MRRATAPKETTMTDFASRISGVAMLALAALPIVALPAHALAATARVSDLNFLAAQPLAPVAAGTGRLQT
jgi:hypothetical protein